jgi:hypothetical protein
MSGLGLMFAAALINEIWLSFTKSEEHESR